jgi:hypothetical protein
MHQYYIYPAIKFAKRKNKSYSIKKKSEKKGKPMDTSSVCVVMITSVTWSIFNNTHSPHEIDHY